MSVNVTECGAVVRVELSPVALIDRVTEVVGLDSIKDGGEAVLK
jgi:hypothetical protein